MDNSTHNQRVPWAWLLSGVALGAISIYYLDPDRGRRRRALVRDQWIHWNKVSNRVVTQKSHHVQNLLHGYWSRLNLRKSILDWGRKSPTETIH